MVVLVISPISCSTAFCHCAKSRMSFACLSCRLHAVVHHDFCERSIELFCLRFCILIFCFRFCILIFCLCFCIFIFCLCCYFFCVSAVFSSIYSMTSWCPFPSSGFSTQFDLIPFMLCCIEFPLFFVLQWLLFSGVVIMKVATTHLWSLPMWIMSLASASLLYSKYLLLVEM